MADLQRKTVEEFKVMDKIPVVIVLDNIRSAHNVGSTLRTADGFGIEKVFLCGITASPPHPEIRKSALGAEESVAWEYVKSTVDAITILKQQGFQIVAVEQVENSTYLQDFAVSEKQKYAFVLGNEVNGVDQNVLDLVDIAVEIPQRGTKHSFNVSVTVGIVLWHYEGRVKCKI